MALLNNSLIALVDDDAQLRSLLQRFLEKNGAVVKCAHNSDQLDLLLKQQPFALIILDYMLPGENGVQIAQRLRAQGNTTAILMLTAKGSEAEQAGFSAGITGFMAKPFNPNDLLNKLKGLLQSQHGNNTTQLSQPLVQPMLQRVKVGDWEFDVAQKTLSSPEQQITLAADEHTVLKLLVQNAGSVMSEMKLCQALGKPSTDIAELLVIIERIRRLIEPIASQPTLLTTVRGAGYKLVLGPAP